MELQAVYKREGYHNYVIFDGQDAQETSTYELQMLLQNEVTDLLSIQVIYINEQAKYMYDISGKQTLFDCLERKKLNSAECRRLYNSIFSAIEVCTEYLLVESHIVLQPQFLFRELEKEQYFFLYHLEYSKDILGQICELSEYLMERVNYEDEQAVYLVYTMYHQSKRKEMSISLLRHVFMEKGQSKEEGRECTIKDYSSIEHKNNKQITANEDKENQRDQGYQRNQENKREKENINGQETKRERENISGQETKREQENISGQETKREQKNISGQKFKRHQGNQINQINQGNQRNLRNTRDQVAEKKQGNQDFMDARLGNYNLRTVKQVVKRPVMEHRQESEEMHSVYPLYNYLITGGIVAIFFVIIVICRYKKVETKNMLALSLIGLSLAAYVASRLFDPKRKIEKYVPIVEYVKTEDAVMNKMGSEESSCSIAIQEQYSESFGIMDEERSNNVLVHDVEIDTGIDTRIDEEIDEEIEEGVEATQLLAIVETGAQCIEETENSTIRYVLTPKEQGYECIAIEELPFYIGKYEEDVDGIIRESTISRVHAKLTKENTELYLTDLGSTNGTYVNDDTLQPHTRRKIQEGDVVRFSNISYVLEERSDYKV
ncbi:DUF6382 domain-containing protein [Anaerosporobacter faecicola]|uniref:DUF6382 domain-containing protein n=1 Tax=Anaerosporobacter faecicola TaxID=2718714 RepID=UPI00143B6D7E|nr:DUF6382 domain-containing protein [Anaerosporobacter faecicola]